MARRPDPFAPTHVDLTFREFERRQREIEDRIARGRPITAAQKAARQRVIDAYNAERQAQGLPPLPTLEERAERAKPKSKPKAERKPGTRKAWALGRLEELLEAGDEKATTKVLREYEKKFEKGNVRDPQKRESLRRNIDRWRVKVEAKIAGRKKSGHLS
jgi:hypothetical protein